MAHDKSEGINLNARGQRIFAIDDETEEKKPYWKIEISDDDDQDDDSHGDKD